MLLQTAAIQPFEVYIYFLPFTDVEGILISFLLVNVALILLEVTYFKLHEDVIHFSPKFSTLFK